MEFYELMSREINKKQESEKFLAEKKNNLSKLLLLEEEKRKEVELRELIKKTHFNYEGESSNN